MRLYSLPFSMSMVPEGVLDELELTYENITMPPGPSTDPDYLKLRPDGLVPTLVDGAVTVYEGSAIAMYLAETYGGGRLAPAPGTPERAAWYQWMIWPAGSLHPAVALAYHPDWFTDDVTLEPAIQAKAQAITDRLWAGVEGQLGDGPWLLGERFTTADLLFLVQALFHHDIAALMARQPKTAALIGRIQARPAVAAMMARHDVPPAPV